MDYDSEAEDCPRLILDLNGDFTLHGTLPTNLPPKFKLHEFHPKVKHPCTGELVTVPGIFAGRPIPAPTSISRACHLMGEGEHGVWVATKFQPPSDSSHVELSPDEVFPLRKANATTPAAFIHRYCIRRRFVPVVSGLKTMCIYTDGACLDNGSSVTSPRAGAAFVFKDGKEGQINFALENKGVDGQIYTHTNSRAELRAVLAALTYRTWWGEGWERIVVITDSEYVANHATGRLRNWAARGWRVASGKPVANKDLWQELSTVMGSFAKSGCEISFWAVPRRMNAKADKAAKTAAERGGGYDKYTVTSGWQV
ncbi:hypothetical protein CROQUDRAFT_231281 [Cronartium quercuum f. sp. fusiforme G11]|uniref:ribonuclease H n=1 Tax=Cronartium quercuum f. sp. fusiforme G11 TaxID=708437 RepID=A0A9P6NVD2_9BASI|nr:hypothetical protein CROQUDRAFT_231281 [Cronartium quercuum f. sp. fusiforme G11]